jgi:hypothetical protein
VKGVQRQSLREKVLIKDRNLLTLKTELVKLYNITVRVKDAVLNVPQEFQEIKELPVLRLEDAYRTLKSFLDQYEKKFYSEKPLQIMPH